MLKSALKIRAISLSRLRERVAHRAGRGWVLALCLSTLLSACATPKPTPIAALELPQSNLAPAPAALERWWEPFNDPALNALIEEALRNNVDVLLAVQRVNDAKVGLSLARSAFIPDINANLGVNRNQISERSGQPLFAGQPRTLTNYNAGLSTTYEVDLWGRLGNVKSAADARLAATQYAQEGVRASVVATVTRAYFTQLALTSEATLLSKTLATREQALQLQQRRVDLGAASEYELKLAESERAAVASQIPRAHAAQQKTQAALAVLLGRSPKDVVEGRISTDKTLESLSQASSIPAGLDAALLQRRPDVREAEATLLAAEQDIQAARKRYFPSLTLTGLLGGQSTSLTDILSAPARTWNLAAGLTQPILGLAKIEAQVERSKIAREQILMLYQQTARAAYADAYSALTQHNALRETLAEYEARVNSQSRVQALTQLRYQAGASSYLELLDAERKQLGAERERVSALRDRLLALVDVYQALGGGWPQSIVARQQP